MAEEDATMEILDPSTSNEIAAVFHIDGGAQHEAWSIFVHWRSELTPSWISILHTLYEALQYPILIPHG